MLYGVKHYYTEYLLGIASLFRVVLGIGILLGLVHSYREITSHADYHNIPAMDIKY